MSENTEVLSADLSEIRKILAGEVKLRNNVIKPLENAVRALKDPHKNAVALAETNLPARDELPDTYLSETNQSDKSHPIL